MTDCTIIITSSFIKSHPSIEFIKFTIESLDLIQKNENTPIILAHDYNSHEDYKKYIVNLENYSKSNSNIKIVTRDSHGHLTGNIRNAMEHVRTEYVLVVQHDFPFIRKFSLDKIVEDAKNNPELKHIRFNKRKNRKCASDALNNLFGHQVQSLNYKYTRTPSWSDNNHFCSTDYYKQIVLKECKDGRAMEDYLIRKSKNEEIHKKYGTYIFGEINAPQFIKHMDGKKRERL